MFYNLLSSLVFWTCCVKNLYYINFSNFHSQRGVFDHLGYENLYYINFLQLTVQFGVLDMMDPGIITGKKLPYYPLIIWALFFLGMWNFPGNFFRPVLPDFWDACRP